MGIAATRRSVLRFEPGISFAAGCCIGGYQERGMVRQSRSTEERMGAGTEGARRCFRGSGGTNREGKRCDVWTRNLFPQSIPRFIPIVVQRHLLWSGDATLKAKRGKASMRYPVLAILVIAAACTPQ